MNEERKPLVNIRIEDAWPAATSIAIGMATVSLIIGVTMYNLNEANVKRAMVERGASPLEVRCAFATSNDNICVIRAIREAK